MVDVFYCFGFEIDDVDVAMRHIQHNNFSVTHLSKHFDDVVIVPLVEYVALLVEMDYTLGLAGFVYSDHEEGVVVGS